MILHAGAPNRSYIFKNKAVNAQNITHDATSARTN